MEIQSYRTLPPLIPVQRFIADVMSEKQQAAWLEDARHLAKDLRQGCFRQMDYGVKGGDAGERCIGKIEGQHVALAEGDVRIEAACNVEHAGREVEAKDICSLVAQIAGDVAGAAAYVADLSVAIESGSEVCEQFPIERL